MDEKRFIQIIQTIFAFTKYVFLFTLLLGTIGIYLYHFPLTITASQNKNMPSFTSIANEEIFTDSIHNATGLIQGKHVEVVIANCTSCHSSKLIIQNRATEEGWEAMIKWMQKTQNLPDLGENEAKIVEYLAAHYAPQKKGRRMPLSSIEWYELDE